MFVCSGRVQLSGRGVPLSAVLHLCSIELRK